MNTIDQIELKGKKVIIRVDFNVPLNEQNEVTDDTRIRAAKPTIDAVLKAGGSCILMSHLGRPKGVTTGLSLQSIAQKVEDVLERKTQLATDCIGNETQSLASNLEAGDILLLENLRFYAEETAGDENFAQQLANLADVYINDAFGTAHRAHASTTIIAQFFSNENKAVGKLLEQKKKTHG